MSLLPARLLEPAKLIFQAANKARIAAILVGGAASQLNGSSRETRDLDVNFSTFKRFKLPNEHFYVRGEDNRLRATYGFETLGAVKVDMVAIGDGIHKLIPFTREYEGIRYASPHLLIADKIKTVGQRSWKKVGRILQDTADIQMMLNHLDDGNGRMPVELNEIFLTRIVMEKFWETVEEMGMQETQVELLREMFEEVGIGT